MKKCVFLLVITFLATAGPAFAMTETDCKAQGGSCYDGWFSDCNDSGRAATQVNKGACTKPGGRGGQVDAGSCCTPKNTTAPSRPAAPAATTECAASTGTCRTACQSGETEDNTKTCTGQNNTNLESRKCCRAASGGSGSGSAATGSLGATAAVNISLANPLKYSTVDGVLTDVMSKLQGIVVTLAILMIVIGAIMYILSFGNPDNIKRAKSVIFAALIGLAIVIAAPAFLREIYSLLGGDVPTVPGGGTQLTLTQIATNILKFLLSLVGVIALIVMIISAFMLFASFGNPDKRKAALEVLKGAIIGVVVAMGSMVLVTAVARFFEN